MGKSLNKRRAELKLQIVVESLRENEVAGVARRYSVHPNQLTRWRGVLMRKGAGVFEPRGESPAQKRIARLENLLASRENELQVLKDCLGFWLPPEGS